MTFLEFLKSLWKEETKAKQPPTPASTTSEEDGENDSRQEIAKIQVRSKREHAYVTKKYEDYLQEYPSKLPENVLEQIRVANARINLNLHSSGTYSYEFYCDARDAEHIIDFCMQFREIEKREEEREREREREREERAREADRAPELKKIEEELKEIGEELEL